LCICLVSWVLGLFIILSNPDAAWAQISFDSVFKLFTGCEIMQASNTQLQFVIDECWKLLTYESLQNLELLLSNTQTDEQQATLFSFPPF